MKYSILLLSFLSLLLFSCGDSDLARSADGLWYSKINVKDENGVPYTVEEYLRLNYIESNEKDGGTFVESMVSHVSDDDGDLKITYDIHSEVSGEWEVLLGDLCTVYDLYSLEVSIENLEFSRSESAGIISRYDIDDLWSLSMSKESLREEIRRDAYKQVMSDYRTHNREAEDENACYSDFKVEGNTLTYSAENITMKMRKIE